MSTANPQILVIDDEQHQLDTVCRGLHLYGYQCHGVNSADEAFDLLVGDGGDGFDLVLTDLTMPGRSGLAVIEKIQNERPDLPIVVIAGLRATAEVEMVREKNIPLLKKPFAPDTLDAVIRKALENGS